MPAPTDHLVPAPDYFTSAPDAAAYHGRLRELLGQLHHGSFWNHEVVRVLVLPSFTPEYALSIERKAQQHHLVYQGCEQRVWPAAQPTAAPAVRVQSLPIGAALAQAVAAAIGTAVDQTRYVPAPDVVLDGTQHYFISQGRCGSTHSPAPDTAMGALVTLVHELQFLATGAATARPEAELQAQAELLTARLRASWPY